MTDIVGVRGDTESYDLTIVDRSAALINLTGCELWFTVKLQPTDSDAEAIVQKTVGSGITLATDQAGAGKGKATAKLDPGDTDKLMARSYYYDVQMKTPLDVITTVVSGTFTLSSDVTKSTS